MTTYLVYDDIYLEHDTGFHPESPERLRRIVAHLKKKGLREQLAHLSPRPAEVTEIAYIHHPAYIQAVKEVAEKGGGYLDADTILSAKSYEAALYAVGGVLTAIDAVMQKKGGTALCLVRPPGHHATPNRGMGFCLFNNVAIGARYLQKKYRLQKILIVDWDLHHGNGTQDAFYDDPAVMYFSMHRFPYYPGTGDADETGKGKGKGFTVNLPLSGRISRTEYIEQFNRVMENQARDFRPDFILISAGFDAYKNDPLGGLGLEIEDYGTLTRKVKALADECGKGRIVSGLEGGYSLDGIPLCIEAYLKGLRPPEYPDINSRQ